MQQLHTHLPRLSGRSIDRKSKLVIKARETVKSSREVLLSQMRQARDKHEVFGRKIDNLIKEIFKHQQVDVQSVTYRVKTDASALRKIERLHDEVKDLSGLHDFLGIRIITYFSDQVDDVARVLRDEFEVDESRTKDRRQLIEADRFGYLSMHLSTRLKANRRELPEWAEFEAIWTEVQIRSSLQHSWAEIEHDLGYKSDSGAIPPHLRRRFSRLAGLLEIADDEFVGLRNELAAHSETVARSLSEGEDVPIDQESMREYISKNATVSRIDQEIAQSLGGLPIITSDVRYAGDRAVELRRLGYGTIREIERDMETLEPQIVELATKWITEPDDEYAEWDSVTGGISVYYLYLYKAAAVAPGEEYEAEQGLDRVSARLRELRREVADRVKDK